MYIRFQYVYWTGKSLFIQLNHVRPSYVPFLYHQLFISRHKLLGFDKEIKHTVGLKYLSWGGFCEESYEVLALNLQVRQWKYYNKGLELGLSSKYWSDILFSGCCLIWNETMNLKQFETIHCCASCSLSRIAVKVWHPSLSSAWKDIFSLASTLWQLVWNVRQSEKWSWSLHGRALRNIDPSRWYYINYENVL